MTVITSNNATARLEFADIEAESVYECVVWIAPEDDGGYSVEIISLPGVASQGDSEKEAVENLKEAFRAAVDAYASSGERIPWLKEIPADRPAKIKEKRILVDV